MKCFDSASFQKHLKEPLCLIISPDDNALKKALKSFLKAQEGPHLRFSCENFLKAQFFQEFETKPFIGEKKTIVLEKVEALNQDDTDFLKNLLQKQNSWITCVLTASKENAHLSKIVEKSGVVLSLTQSEKPWEKEKRRITSLIQEGKEKGIAITFHAAQILVRECLEDSLETELEKLICFVGERKEINERDVQIAACRGPRETIWQLSDAIFEKKGPAALKIGRALFEEGTDFYLLVAQLRSQIQTALESLRAFKEGGNAQVTKLFPYLKGGFLDKKLALFHNYGFENLAHAHKVLFETELKARANTRHEILLEILIAKLTFI